MSTIPKDPNILYSYINMKLRDEYDSLEEFCASVDMSSEEITSILLGIGYTYDEKVNQFR